MKLSGRTAIVTGGARGIGRASAQVFAREGAHVVVADVDEVAGEETVSLIRSGGGEGLFIRTDVSLEAEIIRLVSQAVSIYNTVDILFNNAGVVMLRPLEETTEAEWDRLMSINVKAVFLGIKHVVPHMRRAGRGVILNTGSIASFVGQIGTPAYTASKGAVALLTKSLAVDYGRDQIRVNCLCPGITDTPMLREHLGHGDEGEARIRSRLSRVPLGRILSPDDVAQSALYLVSDDSVGITGVTHVVDGGLLAAAEYDVAL